MARFDPNRILTNTMGPPSPATGQLWSTERAMESLRRAAGTAAPALIFGLRLSASVCLALYIAFWLQLDGAYWAGTSAGIVCQPSLGASLRKGWFLNDCHGGGCDRPSWLLTACSSFRAALRSSLRPGAVGRRVHSGR